MHKITKLLSVLILTVLIIAACGCSNTNKQENTQESTQVQEYAENNDSETSAVTDLTEKGAEIEQNTEDFGTPAQEFENNANVDAFELEF